MKKTNIARNMNASDVMSFSDLYDQISSNWELKAERLLHRRERELKRRMN